MNKLRAYGVTCILFLAAAAVQATTIVLPTDEQLVSKAPAIVEATVVSSTPVDRGGAIWTETVVSVTRTLKGNVPQTITIQEPGGELGDRITMIYGTPEFAPGERVLLFVSPDKQRGGYRVVDLFVGKFSAGEMVNGRRLWLRDDEGQDVNLLDGDLRPVHGRNVQRDAAGFEEFIHERIEGRPGRRNYGVENPVLKPRGHSAAATSDSDESTSITSNFTLISTTVYRWFLFDKGGTAQWYHHGSQPGYTDGGLSELKSGMSSWTSYSSATIYYAYAGALDVAPGGMGRRNQRNEVLFNDPLNEIEGTWSRSTGGVVGIGGFNGVSSGGMWTPPFTADAKYVEGSIRAYEIVEANLVIQDGVTPANGISSKSLAEILAHEFGHTLGFGHSADNTALMYATLTGLGPQLREDDKLAARWLYPNGTGTAPAPTVPAAPSNLAVSVSGNNLDLTWKDNASDETGQSVYLAAGTGSFNKVADVGANVVSTRISGLAGGTYRAYVVAFNSAGTSAASNTVSATVAAAPVASFSFTPSSGTAGVTSFTFYDQSTGTISSRHWNFGDGTTSTAATPTKIYANAGQYTVTLTVSGGGVTSQASKALSVSASLSASFVFSPANPLTTDTVRFTDQSAGAPTAWRWAFSDGSVLTQQNPSKQFTTAGTHSVTLTVYRNNESASATRSISVTNPVSAVPAVIASFSSPSSVATGSPVTFTDTSSGSPTSWSWSFGDGRTSSSQNPVISWAAPGTYHVTLTAANSSSSSTTSKSVTVTSMAAYRTLISAAAQTSGIGGTTWKTELSLFNAGSQGASVTLTYVPSAGSTIQQRSLFLSPKQSVTYANALLDIFGMSSGAGGIGIEATSAGTSADLRVTSRTFTTDSLGTFGQAVPDVALEALQRTLYITGIQSNAAFRTNIGLTNRANAAVAATLTLHNSAGALLGSRSITIPANSFQQSPLSTYFPVVTGGSYDVLTMKMVAGASDSVSAFASVVDNVSQDPIYLQAVSPAVGTTLTVPAVGRAVGANNTFWRSDVTLFNPTAASMGLTLRYGSQTRTISIGAGGTVVQADILSLFGQSSGTGALRVTWSGATGPVVTSRTYTTASGGGTYGQSVEPIAVFARQMFVPGLRNDGTYRTNLGFVNGGGEAEWFTVSILSAAGSELGRTTLSLAPGAQVQYSVAALFPSLPSTIGSFTLKVEGDHNAQLFGYGSMIDNRTADPVFFAGR
jgi:PKD repeat protein